MITRKDGFACQCLKCNELVNITINESGHVVPPIVCDNCGIINKVRPVHVTAFFQPIINEKGDYLDEDEELFTYFDAAKAPDVQEAFLSKSGRKMKIRTEGVLYTLDLPKVSEKKST